MAFHAKTGFRRALQTGQPEFGMMCHSSSAQLVDIMGFRGLDYVMIDTEHAAGADIASTLGLIRAADAAGLWSIVRVDRLESQMIMQALDYGAIGVCVPHIRTKEDAQRAVAAVKYAPEGERGMCPHIRATNYGGRTEWDSYWRVANEETVVIAIVEDVLGLENLEEIAAVPGLDVIWIGGGDLSQSLGIAGDFESPIIKAAQQRGLEVAQRNGKTVLFALPVRNSAARVAEWYERGYRFFLWPDTAVFNEAVRDLADGARAAIATPAVASLAR